MKRWMLNGLLIVFIAIFLVSGYLLVDYYLESHKQQSSYDDLADIMHQATQPAPPQEDVPVVTGPDLESVETVTPAPTHVPVIDPDTGEEILVLPEFAELYTMNSDLVAWITIEDTMVDYPVMHKPDQKSYYLRKNFFEEYSSHGCVYVEEECNVFYPTDNVTIYGHRMSDGTMFYDLLKYADKDFWEEHRYITFNTLFERHTYEIFAVFKIASDIDSPFQYHHFVDAYSEEEYDEYIDNCLDYALYNTGIVPTYGDKLITLSTCEYSQVNGRMVVVAVRTDRDI